MQNEPKNQRDPTEFDVFIGLSVRNTRISWKGLSRGKRLKVEVPAPSESAPQEIPSDPFRENTTEEEKILPNIDTQRDTEDIGDSVDSVGGQQNSNGVPLPLHPSPSPSPLSFENSPADPSASSGDSLDSIDFADISSVPSDSSIRPHRPPSRIFQKYQIKAEDPNGLILRLKGINDTEDTRKAEDSPKSTFPSPSHSPSPSPSPSPEMEIPLVSESLSPECEVPVSVENSLSVSPVPVSVNDQFDSSDSEESDGDIVMMSDVPSQQPIGHSAEDNENDDDEDADDIEDIEDLPID